MIEEDVSSQVGWYVHRVYANRARNPTVSAAEFTEHQTGTAGRHGNAGGVQGNGNPNQTHTRRVIC